MPKLSYSIFKNWQVEKKDYHLTALEIRATASATSARKRHIITT
jgi:hypothetical protein